MTMPMDPGSTSPRNGVLPAGSVSLAEMADLAQSTVIGRAAGAGTGVPTALTATQATALLDTASTTAAGINRLTASRVYWQAGVASSADTNSPAAKQEWLAGLTTRRQTADLTGRTQVRGALQTAVPGFAGSKLAFQYSVDGGANWVYLDGTADATPIGAATPQLAYDTAAGTLTTSAWATLHAAARTEVLLRVVTSGGDGIVDPTLFYLWLEFR